LRESKRGEASGYIIGESKRGEVPPKVNFPLFSEGGLKESQREVKPLLYNLLPLPLIKGKGDKGG